MPAACHRDVVYVDVRQGLRAAQCIETWKGGLQDMEGGGQ
jgi:hypothetical protein